MDYPFTLDDVVTNSALVRRHSRSPDYAAESNALKALAKTMADSPQAILQKLVEIALELCRADTAGISLLENHNGEELFRWEALAGVLRDHVNGTMPRKASPCGTTIDRNATQLMYLPERFFPALKIKPPIVEALLIPFAVEKKPVGTVWVVAHDNERKFDQEDERIIRTLAEFAAAAWQLWQARRTAESATTSARELTKDLVATNRALQVQIDHRNLAEQKLQQLISCLETTAAQGRVDLATAAKDLLHTVEAQNELQNQLRHAQKMETIGTLAGGIAHDFNNVLHIIQGYVTIMRQDLRDSTKLDEYIHVIDETVKEGAALTNQLLTVARKNNVKFDPTSINSLITTMAKWLESTLPKTIEIELGLDSSIPPVRADANQLNQVLLNLCVNARDAMADSGTLRLSTSMVPGRELQNHFPGTEDQNYVCIAVGDTGTGIPEDVRQHIFEPFFTTKDQQKGTGLGLSIVYGIVTSHRGLIEVDSEPGQGTTFKIYLPVLPEA